MMKEVPVAVRNLLFIAGYKGVHTFQMPGAVLGAAS